MLPNYINEEYLLAEKLSLLISSPRRGDVVIFKYPKNPTVNYIKRVIGLPGEMIKIENSVVTIINSEHPYGVVLDESYLSKGVQTLTGKDKKFSITIPADSYFVMGDNREHSSDSREWGLLPSTNIVGHSWLTVKPLDRFGFQRQVTYPNISIRSIENITQLALKAFAK